jgi:ammonia channel protein AmtB
MDLYSGCSQQKGALATITTNKILNLLILIFKNFFGYAIEDGDENKFGKF